jgi:hypothetical protein
MNPEKEIELVLRVLSTRPTDEEIFHLEHEDVNSRKVEQEPEEKPEEEPEQEPEEEPEQEPEEEPEEKPEEEPEEEPVPLPVPVGIHASAFLKWRALQSSIPLGEPNSSFRSRLKCRGCAQCARLGVGSWAVDFGQSSFTLKTLKSVLTFFPILPPAVMGTRCPAV